MLEPRSGIGDMQLDQELSLAILIDIRYGCAHCEITIINVGRSLGIVFIVPASSGSISTGVACHVAA